MVVLFGEFRDDVPFPRSVIVDAKRPGFPIMEIEDAMGA
jgi:hypothetical protein